MLWSAQLARKSSNKNKEITFSVSQFSPWHHDKRDVHLRSGIQARQMLYWLQNAIKWPQHLKAHNQCSLLLPLVALSEGNYSPHNLCPGNTILAQGPLLSSPHIMEQSCHLPSLHNLGLEPNSSIGVLVVLIFCFHDIFITVRGG